MAELVHLDVPPFTPEVKKTLGQQIYENHIKYAGQFTQTARETTDEMGKEYMKSLEKCLSMNSKIRKPYFIYEILRPHSVFPNVIECKHIARFTEPLPEWGTALYKVDNVSGEWWYLWGLPHEIEAARFMVNPFGFEKKTIDDIVSFEKYLIELPKLISNEDIPALKMSTQKRDEAAEKLLKHWHSAIGVQPSI